MKRGLPIFLSAALLLSACSDPESAVSGGSLLGSVLGAAVGEVIGGSNGSEIGSIVGGIAGGAIGASTVQRKPCRGRYAFIGEGDAGNPYDRSQIGRAGHTEASGPAYTYSEWTAIEVRNVQMADSVAEATLTPKQPLPLTMDIYNNGSDTLQDVQPLLACDNPQVRISPAVHISSLAPGQGVRYKVILTTKRPLRQQRATFSVYFGQGEKRVKALSFTRRLD